MTPDRWLAESAANFLKARAEYLTAYSAFNHEMIHERVFQEANRRHDAARETLALAMREVGSRCVEHAGFFLIDLERLAFPKDEELDREIGVVSAKERMEIRS
jgi:hypothetical protein